MIYDNRSGKLPDGQIPGLHLSFRANGRRVLYCYIRKNACSCFKRMIVSRSKHKENLSGFPSRVQFMRHFHGVTDIRPEEYEHSLFVIRDPLDRIISVWKNKFIQRNGHEDIFASYAAQTGRDPETACFADFMNLYIGRPFRDLDLHVRPQSHDLAPVVYSDAVLLENLHSHMTGITGPKIADRFFLRRMNSSSNGEEAGPQEAWSSRSADLHALWREKQAMPPTRSFISPPVREKVAALYGDDHAIYRAVHAASQSPGPVPASAQEI